MRHTGAWWPCQVQSQWGGLTHTQLCLVYAVNNIVTVKIFDLCHTQKNCFKFGGVLFPLTVSHLFRMWEYGMTPGLVVVIWSRHATHSRVSVSMSVEREKKKWRVRNIFRLCNRNLFARLRPGLFWELRLPRLGVTSTYADSAFAQRKGGAGWQSGKLCRA